MFGLTQYNGNGALMATTGFMLAPIASALSNREYSVSREEPILSIAPAQPDSDWGEWLTSGYMGDFLGWAGKQLAEVGSNIFPSPSKIERVQTMRANKREIKQFLSEKMLGEAVSADISETLNSYLRNGLVLMQMDSLNLEEWQVELMDLKRFSDHTGNEAISAALSEWIEQLVLLQMKHEQESDPQNVVASVPTSASTYPAVFDVSALNGTSGFKMIDSVVSGWFGRSVSGAGDVNGDGFADLIVGGEGENTQKGAAYVVFGQGTAFPTPFDVSILNTYSNPRGFKMTDSVYLAGFGYSVSGAGDVNGDGFADLIVGASGTNYVIFGQGTSFPASFDVSILNAYSNPRGFKMTGGGSLVSVSGAGDVNADGFGDLIVGGSYVNVIFGQGTSFPASFDVSILNAYSNPRGFKITDSSVKYAHLGSVSGAGDVNGDGFADLIVGAYENVYPAYTGASYVIFGQNTTFPASFDVSILSAYSNPRGFKMTDSYMYVNFGNSVSGAGDVNADGFADLIVGAYKENYNGVSYVIFGQKTSFPNSFDVTTLSAVSNPRGFKMTDSMFGDFGISVSDAGDVNGDGFADLIVGADYENRQGASYVVFGQAASFPNSFDVSILSDVSNPRGFKMTDSFASGFSIHFGYSVSSAGDVNADGFADLIVGAYGENSYNGASYVIFGSEIANGTTNSLNAPSKANNPYGFFSTPTVPIAPEPLTELNRKTRLRGGR